MKSSKIGKEDFKTCLRVLETLVSNRDELCEFSTEDRKSIMIAAGRLSRPDKLEQMKQSKTFRKLKKRKARHNDARLRDETGIRKLRESTTFSAPLEISFPPKQERVLAQPRNCYVCKSSFSKLHFFYDSMCKECGDLNYHKRFQSADLTSRIALVTGARVKIGFQTTLKLLRAGAKVIATTRFPNDATSRYTREPDFNEWKDRLDIFGLDLRHSPSVEIFCRYVNQHYPSLDALVNNAAQTVRRPPGFYRHLMKAESVSLSDLSDASQNLLASFQECKSTLSNRLKTLEPVLEQSSQAFSQPTAGIENSASLSLIPYAYDEDTKVGIDVFPEGKKDADEQQVDLRKTNSWRLKLSEVATPEMLEVHLVNAVAPFILCSKLKPMMERSRFEQKHIINVSAMEGKFTRFTKTDRHPHTNMAKAALNMMTMTSAPDYAKSGIYMNAVDTGWVTDEDPFLFADRKERELNFQPPLDIVDGASRILDPLFTGILFGNCSFGKFYKDYVPTTW